MLPYDRMSWTETDRPETSFVKSSAERLYISKGQENLSRRKKTDNSPYQARGGARHRLYRADSRSPVRGQGHRSAGQAA